MRNFLLMTAVILGSAMVAPKMAVAREQLVCVQQCINRNAAGGYCFQEQQYCGLNAQCVATCNTEYLDGSCAVWATVDTCYSENQD